jgi:hypothetical protein
LLCAQGKLEAEQAQLTGALTGIYNAVSNVSGVPQPVLTALENKLVSTNESINILFEVLLGLLFACTLTSIFKMYSLQSHSI